MATLIDSLVMTLGLDAKGFKAGQVQANSGMAALREGATKTGADVGKVTQGLTQGFARVRTELLGLLGLFVATKSIAGLTSQVTAQDAALGRLSSRLGISTGDISAWDRAAQSAGAQAGDATGSLTGMSAAFERFKLTGQGGDTFIPYLTRLGVHLANADGKMKSATEQQLELARAFQAMDRTDPKATDFYASQLPGSSQGNTDFLRRGPEFVQARLDKQRAIGLPTPQDARNAQDILEQLGYVDQRMTTFGRHLLNDVSPGITRVLSRLGDWLDRHLPGWYAKIDPIIQGFMGSLDKLDFDHVASEVMDFGRTVRDTFRAIAEWKPPAWMTHLLGIDTPDAAAGSTPSGTPADGVERAPTSGGGQHLVGTPEAQQELGQRAIAYFVAQGRTPEQAAGIVGNLHQESGFDASAGFDKDGNPGAHSGIAQWSKARREEIEAHFGQKLKDMDFDRQLQAVQYELTQGKYQGVNTALGQTRTSQDSSNVIAHGFEIPVSANDPDAARKWAEEERKRGGYAAASLQRWQGAAPREVAADGRTPKVAVPAQVALPAFKLAPAWQGPPANDAPRMAPDRPGDAATEKPDLDGLKRYLAGQGGQSVPSAAERWGSSTTNNTAHHDNSSSTVINGGITVQSQAKDAPGIARDIGAALKARTAAAQANRGLA